MSITPLMRSGFGFQSSALSNTTRAAILLAAITASTHMGATAFADTYANNGNTNLSLPASWIDESTPANTSVSAPGAADIAQWDANAALVTPTTFSLGGSTTWLGMTLLNPGADLILVNDGSAFNLGTSGIDMFNAQRNLTLNNSLNMTGSQIWNIAPGHIITDTNVISGAANITKTGLGTLILSGANTYSGSTIITGTEILDFTFATAPASNIINNPNLTNGLVLTAGKLVINGSSSAGNSQSFANLNVNTGASSIDVIPGSGQTASLTFAAAPIRIQGINNSTTGGTLRYGTTGMIAINGLFSRFLLEDPGNNAYATYGLYDWAATDANGNITAANYVTSGPLASNNLDVTANLTVSNGNAGSLRFNNSSAPVTLTIGSVLSQGGILMTPNSVGATIAGSSIRPNHVSSNGASFSIIQNSTAGDLTISSVIPNGSSSTPTAVVKSGVGNLILANANNTYTGQTFINEGTITINADGDLGNPGSGAAITFSGGALQTTANVGLYSGSPGSFNRAINLNIGGGTLEPAAGTTLSIPGVISGPGPLTISKAGTVILSGNNTYAGNTSVLNNAILQLDSNAGTSTIAIGSANGTTVGTLTGSSSNSTNNVVIDSGSTFFPGHDGVGNMTLNSLAVGSDGLNGDPLGGATLDFSLSKTGNVTSVTNQLSLAANGTFTLNGTNTINLYASGTTSPITNSGTFILANLNGASTVGDPFTSFNVANALPQVRYLFFFNADKLEVLIANPGPPPVWAADVSGTWSNSLADASNWLGDLPPGSVAGASVTFSNNLGSAPVLVTLADPEAFGSLFFGGSSNITTPTTYTINGSGANGLTVNLGATNNGGITVGGGTNTINANMTLAGTGVGIGVNNDTAANVTSILAIGGIISDNGQQANVSVTGTGTVILSANNTYGGSTNIGSGTTLQLGKGATFGNASAGNIKNNGTLAFNYSTSITLPNNISGNGSLSQIGAANTTLTGNYTATGNISVAAGNLTFASTANTRQDTGVVLKMSNLSIASTSVLDVTNHDLIIGNSNVTTIQTEILNGFGSGPGGAAISSSTAIADGNKFLVPIDAATFGITSWDNVPITDPNTVIVKYTYFGDINLDGQVDAGDYATLDGFFGPPAGPGGSIVGGDADLSGVVDAGDYAFLDNFFGDGVGNPLIAVSPNNVPEPASLSLLGLGAAVLMPRKRRNS